MQTINHTQISNEFLDEFMADLSGNAVKVYLAISRKTIGWHKDTDRISNSQLQKMTGIKSRITLKAGIDELIKKHIIFQERIGGGKGTETYYEINYNQSKINGSKNDLLDPSNGSEINPLVNSNGSEIDPTKDINNNIAINTINKEYKESALPKKHFFDSEYVLLTEDEYRKLVDKYGEEFTAAGIEKLDNYLGAVGKKYKSHYRAFLNWVVDEMKKKGYTPKISDQEAQDRTRRYVENECQGSTFTVATGRGGISREKLKKIKEEQDAKRRGIDQKGISAGDGNGPGDLSACAPGGGHAESGEGKVSG